MKKELISVCFILLILASSFVLAVGSSTNDGVGNNGAADNAGATVSGTNPAKIQCAGATLRERVKCRLENRARLDVNESEWKSEESCKNLPANMTNRTGRPNITRGLCQALYSTSKLCYRLKEQGESEEKITECFERASGLQRRVSEERENKDGLRKYIVLRLYNLQERVEKAQENGKINADSAAEIITLIVKIKEDIMKGEKTKAEIRAEINDLKQKIRDARGEI